jgi:hypothetical protein
MGQAEEKLNKAWLVKWGFHSADEDVKLRECGITNKIVDFFNTRKQFEEIIVYVKNIYRNRLLSLGEKLYLSHYTFGKKREKELFGGSIPVFTNYQSDLYRKLMECFRNEGLYSKKYNDLLEKWVNYPQFVLVGHNPYLEASLVYNLKVSKNISGSEVLEWEWLTVDGEQKQEKYTMRGLYD